MKQCCVRYFSYYGVFLLLLSSFGVASCGSIKKMQLTSKTETIIKIDTLIKIKTDTITIYQRVPIYDTAYIESKTSKAKSYYDSHSQKIVLSLTGKVFDVPVTVSEIRKQNIKETDKTVTPVNRHWGFWFFITIITIVILYMLYKHFKL